MSNLNSQFIIRAMRLLITYRMISKCRVWCVLVTMYDPEVPALVAVALVVLGYKEDMETVSCTEF